MVIVTAQNVPAGSENTIFALLEFLMSSLIENN